MRPLLDARRRLAGIGALSRGPQSTISLAFLILGFASARVEGEIELLSRAVEPPLTAGATGPSSVSQDGRYVAFLSGARNLVPGQVDVTPRDHVFVRDLTTGAIVLASHAAGLPARPANGVSFNPAISADGRYVAFDSQATDFVAGLVDTNGSGDVFVFDRVTGVVSIVSHRSNDANTAASGWSRFPTISADGRVIAYVSVAPDLIPGQIEGAGTSDVFLFDRTSNASTLVSQASGSPATAADASSTAPLALSADGSFLAFRSYATDLVPGQIGRYGVRNVFLYSRATAQSQLVSHLPGSVTQAASGDLRAISGNGRYVCFTTSDNLSATEPDGDGLEDLYRFDRTTGTNILVSRLGAPPVDEAATSHDGRWTAFEATGNIHLFDAITGGLRLISRLAGTSLPATVNGATSRLPRISGDGRFVVYTSDAADLVAGQVDVVQGGADAFLYDRDADQNVLVSHRDSSVLSAVGIDQDAAVLDVAFSVGGTRVVFPTGSGLTPGDTNHAVDVFAYDRATTVNTAVSVRAAGMPSATANDRSFTEWLDLAPAPATQSRISADGGRVLFVSDATNLLPGQVEDPRIDDWIWEQPPNIYLRDRTAARTALVNHAVTSEVLIGNEPAGNGVISGDGRAVVFDSAATDLVAGVNWRPGTGPNVFIHDVGTGTNNLVTRSALVPTDAVSGTNAGLSGDGRYLLLSSTASDLVPGQVDPNAGSPQSGDVFLYDRTTSTMTLVSHAAGAPSTTGNDASGTGTLSADGGKVVFTSLATDLVPGQTGSSLNLFLFDRPTNENRLISHAAGLPTQAADRGADVGVISGDGAYVAYLSDSTDIVPGSPTRSAYLYEVASGTSMLVNRAGGYGWVSQLALDAQGRFVAYEVRWSNEIPEQVDRNDLSSETNDVFLFDRITFDRVLVSHSSDSSVATGDRGAHLLGLSADGRYVLFWSTATDIVPGSSSTLYLFDRVTGTNAAIPSAYGSGFLSADGSHVAFSSTASTLVPGDWNGFADAFVWGETSRADVRVVKTGPPAAVPGQTLTFVVHVSSVGRLPADNVVLSDPTPPGLIQLSVTGDCTALPCSLGSLAVGATKQVSVGYSVPADYSSPAPIVNTASVSTTSVESDLTNNVASAQATLPSAFFTVTPCRLIDTRNADGPFGGPVLTAGATRSFSVPGSCSVPQGTKSLAVNVTVVSPTQAGFLRLSSTGVAPQTSTMNFGAGQTRANSAVVPLGAGGFLSATVGMAAPGTSHLILDVVGFFK